MKGLKMLLIILNINSKLFYLTFGTVNKYSILDIHLPPHFFNKGTFIFYQKRVC